MENSNRDFFVSGLQVGKCKYNIVRNGDIKHLCDDSCFKRFRSKPTSFLQNKKAKSPSPEPISTEEHEGISQDAHMSVGDAVDLGSCDFCSSRITNNSHGWFKLQVGKEMKQFCQNSCIQHFKKNQRICATCQKDLSGNKNAFMAPSPDGSFKDYCSQSCLKISEKKAEKAKEDGDEVEIVGTSRVAGPKTRSATGINKCSVCSKLSAVKHEVNFGGKIHKLCSDPCFAAFRYANKLTLNTCDNCGVAVYIENNPQTIHFEGKVKRFCTTKCVDTFKKKRQKTVPCAWCNNKRNNFDMIERVDANGKFQLFCSLNCLSLYRVNLQATSNQNIKCDQCQMMAPAQYHLTMSDASVRNFCAYQCVMAFQGKFTNPQPGSKQPSPVKQPQKNITTPTNDVTPTTNPVRTSARQAARGECSHVIAICFTVVDWREPDMCGVQESSCYNTSCRRKPSMSDLDKDSN